MTSNDNFDSTYFIVSEGNDNDDSLMLTIELFPTEQDYIKTLNMSDISKSNSVQEHSLKAGSSDPVCADRSAHGLKSKLKSRISNTLKRVNRRSWVSSRYKLKTAKAQYDQICEFINATVNQTKNSNEDKQRSIKIKSIDHMSNSDQIEESTYCSHEHSNNHATKDQNLEDACDGLKHW